MSIIKIYLSEKERESVEADARKEGVSLSSYIKKKLGVKSGSVFSEVLWETIEITSTIAPGDFSVPDLYSGIDWRDITKKVHAGQLGKQFYEQVKSGNVPNVVFKEIKNRKAYYTKLA